MISNEKALEVVGRIDIYGDRYKIYRNPNYQDTVIVANISDNGEFHNIAIVTYKDEPECEQYAVQLVTQNKIENSYELSSNSDKYIPFPGQITQDVFKALYEENGLNYDPSDMNKLFTSNEHNNIVISAFPEDTDKWYIDSFLTYDQGSQAYKESNIDTNDIEDCGDFYEPEKGEGVLTEDEYYEWVENEYM